MKERKYRIGFILVCAIVFFLVLWNCLNMVTADGQSSQEENVKHTDINACTNEKEKSSLELKAVELIEKAFSFDVSCILPDESSIDQGNGTTFQYVAEKNDRYIVEFKNGYEYPTMLYHFFHFNEDSVQEFDLAEESSEYFKEEMVSIAKDFLYDIYGINCSEAMVHGFGYSNKIAVQLEVDENQIFQVRFYYDDLSPVGVLFCDDVRLFDENMRLNEAKTYF